MVLSSKEKEVRVLPNHHPETLDTRLSRLEERIEQMQKHLEQLIIENQKMKQDFKFFELMLLEEYQLLIHLLGKDQNRLFIQSVGIRPKMND
jgi:hypothetical protein